MFHFTCPGCTAPRAVADAERIGGLCSSCGARQTWQALTPEDQRTVDAAVRRGSIVGLLAMRDLTPPIRLPHAADLLAFRQLHGDQDGLPHD
ncbi:MULTISPECIES: hypothetical protein [Actinoplanes]|uniref:hypothetical protein n=1 Tax=Actinoplanes TaxID=1865 RepID=UPI0005F2A8AE|nr:MULTISPECIES: hypothetical protein [Actinoplanes]GLY05442.1 hypothetical protein Acsp01_58210 [Actinoplanes sp. NBRC 101535]